jgi:hypothetical protein
VVAGQDAAEKEAAGVTGCIYAHIQDLEDIAALERLEDT